ncbi:hypothetical protein [Limosilactobacillus caviae]|uniref:hypothetical protein n=1 Tax=Limosilactobacillus caviae TaxID=1769424 RepID=UPI001E4A23AE|nr:hypothetical protein [Limosilactobacillus caviae]MCD7124114.1 hypothetical protein [Limosilactobacillus caviae]
MASFYGIGVGPGDRKLLDKTVIVENASMANQRVQRLTEYSANDQLPYFSTALLKKKEA